MNRYSKYIIFLNNRYCRQDNDFYLGCLPNKVSIAADGGIRFFLTNKIAPDILIGDFDSAPRLSKSYLREIEVIQFPAIKDKTDSQLALELALTRGAREVEICGALSVSEIDHTLGNIFILEIAKRYQKKYNLEISARIVDPRKTIYLLENESVNLTGKPGHYVSIIPLVSKCRVKYDGLEYPAPAKTISAGDSLTLRNRFKGHRARISAAGKVLVINYSSLPKNCRQ